MDTQTLIETAKRLGIKVTRAKEGTQIFECWADRVEQADWLHRPLRFADCEMPAEAARRNAAIAAANAYAI